MKLDSIKPRHYASFFILGSGFLTYRTIRLIVGGALGINATWVSALLFLEMLIDAACVLTSIIWWIKDNNASARLPVNLCAAMVIVHAIRVTIFVIGRLGPWIDFDVKPEARAMHDTRWTWEGVYIAGILSALSIIAVVIIWIYRKRITLYRTDHN